MNNRELLPLVETMQLQSTSVMSKAAYASDALCFMRWMAANAIDLGQLNKIAIYKYQNYLHATYAKNTVARRLVSLRLLLDLAVEEKLLPSNPAREARLHIKYDDSSPHVALTKSEAKRLLAVVDQSTPIGKRDYALLLLLIFGGVRRSEAAHIKIGDITSKMEHKVLTIKHGKGDKRRDVVLKPEMFRAIYTYLEATNRLNDSPDAALFCGFYRGGANSGKAIGDKRIETLVKNYGVLAGLVITPHDLRASAITYLIDTGAPLIQVQRIAGHSSPATTERYYSRKQDLDDSPIYKVSLDE